MKKIETFVLGMAQVNTYLLWNDSHVLIIDPGSNSPKLQASIDEKQGIVDGILLTHGHFDHIAGVDRLIDKYHCNLYMNDLDRPMLTSPQLNCSTDMGTQQVIVHTIPKILLPNKNTIGVFTFTLIDAPGHSEGCSMIIWDNNLFSGDVIFAGGIGRTDLPGGSNSKMMNTLRNCKVLSPALKVYPGHGPATDMQTEFMYNPYLQ